MNICQLLNGIFKCHLIGIHSISALCRLTKSCLMGKHFACLSFAIIFCSSVCAQTLSTNNAVSMVLFFSVVLLAIFLLLSLIGLIIVKRRETRNIRKLSANKLRIQNLENEKRENALQQRTTELEMQALRAQMNPHFIFNCLNAINHFILVNEVNTASDYLTKFSRLIRIVLDNSFRKNIFLSEELESLRLYIELEQIRFDHHFSFEISLKAVSDMDDIVIPPMLLQPFVENAIWHGLMYKDGSGI